MSLKYMYFDTPERGAFICNVDDLAIMTIRELLMKISSIKVAVMAT